MNAEEIAAVERQRVGELDTTHADVGIGQSGLVLQNERVTAQLLPDRDERGAVSTGAVVIDGRDVTVADEAFVD